MHTKRTMIRIASCFTISDAQRDEFRTLYIASFGNLRTVVENFTWDTDSYTKLEMAYREAETANQCTLIDLPVCAYYAYNIH